MHQTSFWRLGASYNLFLKGYPVDTASLLRALYENAIYIVAVNEKIISPTSFFEKVIHDKNLTLDDTTIYKRMINEIRKNESLVKKYLVGKESVLRRETQEDLEIFIRVFHYSIYKNKLGIAFLFNTWSKGLVTSVFPAFDVDQMSLWLNYSNAVG